MPESLGKLFTRRTTFAAIALMIVFTGALWLEGRPWWCKFGVGLWSNAWTHCTSQHFLDPYSLTHVLHGIILYWLLRPLAARISPHWRTFAALVLEVGWELLENSPWVIERYRQQTAALDYAGDSIINALGDVAMAAIGVLVASRFSWKVSVAVFLAVELGLLLLIRDNLTLNVLMLFLPLEALKQWQLRTIGS